MAAAIDPNAALHFPPPNYIDPTTRGNSLYYVNSVFFVTTTVVVALRIYTRICVRNWFGLDDAFVLLALISAGGVMYCVFLGYHDLDWNKHIWNMLPSHMIPAGKVLYAAKCLWAAASASVRLSIVCHYYRLLKHVGLEKYRWVLHLNCVYIVIVFLLQVLTMVLACLPVTALWTWPPDLNARCINQRAALLAGASLNTLSDFILAALPIPVLYELRMSSQQRRAVAGLLSLGFVVTLAGISRTYLLQKDLETNDPSWWAMPYWVASELEIDLSLICCCVPVLRPMIGRVLLHGPGKAKRPVMSESGLPSRSSTVRSRSLFGKRSNATLRKSDSVRSATSNSWCQIYDLEGIANDGLGYTVSITSTSEQPTSKGWWKGNPRRRRLQEVIYDDAATPQDTTSRAKRTVGFKNSRDVEVEGTEVEKQGIQVMTTRDVRIQEGCQTSQIRTWGVRNSYVPVEHQKDVEKGIESAAAGLTDWSLLKSESPIRINAATITSENGNDVQDEKVKSRSSSVTSQREPSPQLPPSVVLPVRSGRTASPVIQPLNSSQFWASTSPRVSRAGSRQGEHTEGTESWSGVLNVVPEPSWDQERPISYHSSVAARTGSWENLVIGEDSESPPDAPTPPLATLLPVRQPCTK